MRIIPLIALLAAGAAVATTAGCAATTQQQQQRPLGVETSIPYAANGGIRNWEAGPPDSGILYVQDRNLDWYKVEMSGPCIETRAGPMTVHYTTSATGRLDTFSELSFPDYPGRTCGIKRITTSLPPPSQPGAPDTDSEE
jgi:hypothetical protein